jgi:hypothetical protein
MDNQKQKLLNKINNKVNEMIPEQWDKIYIYGEVTENSGLVSFYYFPKDSTEYVFSAMLPHLFDISAIDYYNDEDELLQLIRKLHDDAVQTDDWTSVTFIIDSDGKTILNYGHEDLSQSTDYDRQIVWEYKYLGVGPRDEGDVKIIERYLNAKK